MILILLTGSKFHLGTIANSLFSWYRFNYCIHKIFVPCWLLMEFMSFVAGWFHCLSICRLAWCLLISLKPVLRERAFIKNSDHTYFCHILCVAARLKTTLQPVPTSWFEMGALLYDQLWREREEMCLLCFVEICHKTWSPESPIEELLWGQCGLYAGTLVRFWFPVLSHSLAGSNSSKLIKELWV